MSSIEPIYLQLDIRTSVVMRKIMAAACRLVSSRPGIPAFLIDYILLDDRGFHGGIWGSAATQVIVSAGVEETSVFACWYPYIKGIAYLQE